MTEPYGKNDAAFPKGVMLSHASMLGVAYSMAGAWGHDRIESGLIRDWPQSGHKL